MTIFGMYIFSWLFRVVATTYGIGVVSIVLFFLAPAFISAQARAWLGIIGICCLCSGSFYWVAFHQGETFMASKVAARDWEALQRIKAGEKEVNDCNGGVDWDVVTGTCNK